MDRDRDSAFSDWVPESGNANLFADSNVVQRPSQEGPESIHGAPGARDHASLAQSCRAGGDHCAQPHRSGRST